MIVGWMVTVIILDNFLIRGFYFIAFGLTQFIYFSLFKIIVVLGVRCDIYAFGLAQFRCHALHVRKK
jgi:hypothetical protein